MLTVVTRWYFNKTSINPPWTNWQGERTYGATAYLLSSGAAHVKRSDTSATRSSQRLTQLQKKSVAS